MAKSKLRTPKKPPKETRGDPQNKMPEQQQQQQQQTPKVGPAFTGSGEIQL